MATESPVITPKEKQLTQLDTPWNVLIFDDPVNLMDYVTKVIQRLFGYSREIAEKHMVSIHEKGKTVVWTGGKERAELYVEQLHAAQLQASIEKAN